MPDSRPADGRAPWRETLRVIIFEADTPAGKAFDVALLVTILVSVGIVMVESVAPMRERFGRELDIAEWGFTLLFTVEYVFRLLTVRRPTHYARSFFGVVDVLAIPGHAPDHLAFYDRQTGLMLSGDSFLPGRLLIFDFAAFLDSVLRLASFTADNEVCRYFGGHIEMSNTLGVDFPPASNFHPDEHPLSLYQPHLDELLDSLLDMQNDPVVEYHDEFIIAPIG